MVRRVLLILAASAVAGAVAFWVRVVEPVRRHHAFCPAVDAELKTLAKKRPA